MTQNIVRSAIRRGKESFHMTALTLYNAPSQVSPMPLVTIRDIKDDTHIRLNPDEVLILIDMLNQELKNIAEAASHKDEQEHPEKEDE